MGAMGFVSKSVYVALALAGVIAAASMRLADRARSAKRFKVIEQPLELRRVRHADGHDAAWNLASRHG